MKKRVTIHEVADEAGVSLMTVSRVLNNRSNVHPDTRTRIMDIARQLGYRPSRIARSLATRRTGTIGLIVPDVSNAFFAQIARGAEDVAFANGYSLFLMNFAEDAAREHAALDHLWEKEVDGAILCSSRLPTKALTLAAERLPYVVLVNRHLPSAASSVIDICVDYIAGTQLAIEHLLAMGRRNIALVAGPQTSESARRRLIGYRQGLQNAGLPFREEWVLRCSPDIQGGLAAGQQLLRAQPAPDAILAFNDLVAVGVMQACEEVGRTVPTDIAVIGADDIPLMDRVRPQLTTLHIDLNALGVAAMTSLLSLMAGQTIAQRHTLIRPELRLRESA